MGNRYLVSRYNITPVAGQDVLTCISGSGRRIRLVSVTLGGVGSSRATQELQVGRSTGGTTPGGAITPDKADHTDEPAANFTTSTTWSAQPTLMTNPHIMTWNALGGQSGFTPPGKVLEARNGENISFRYPSSGVSAQNMSISALVEED
jgi:hypothetical protein